MLDFALIIVPGGNVEGLAVVADNGRAHDAPFGIVRAPHVDFFVARLRRSEPRRPKRNSAAVRAAVLLVRIIDVYGVVHRCDDHRIEFFRRRMAVQRRQIEETDLGAIAELFSRGFRFDR